MVVCASVPGFRQPGVAMYLGKTLFAQAMDFLPWKTFQPIETNPAFHRQLNLFEF